MDDKKEVIVLMSTYNGRKYIGEQLRSIYGQKGVACSLLVRDDGSTDGTCGLLGAEQDEGRLKWYAGENVGPAWAFWDLLEKAPCAEWYAFADQDDVWMDDKLAAALAMMEDCGDKPALYFGQTQLVDEKLSPLKNVEIHPLVTYGEALIYQFAGGNTMVLNNALRKRLLEYKPSYMRMHDVWVYDVALALDAVVRFDSEPRILYRQHALNAVGQSHSAARHWKERIGRLWKRENIRSRIAGELWKGYADSMSAENRRLTYEVANYSRWTYKWNVLRRKELKCANRFVSATWRFAVLFNLF